MIISLIVAASENNAIGKNNQLLWHLPNDLKFFKNTTWAMPVIMGRRTYESFTGDNPLPGRFNIVITRQAGWKPIHDRTQVATSLMQALDLARKTDCRETFIAGGGQIYAGALPVADKIYLTRVHAALDGDTFFPVIDEKKWALTSNIDFPADEKHAYAYSFQVWEKKLEEGKSN
jgi:dihydrofolate reductase